MLLEEDLPSLAAFFFLAAPLWLGDDFLLPLLLGCEVGDDDAGGLLLPGSSDELPSI